MCSLHFTSVGPPCCLGTALTRLHLLPLSLQHPSLMEPWGPPGCKAPALKGQLSVPQITACFSPLFIQLRLYSNVISSERHFLTTLSKPLPSVSVPGPDSFFTWCQITRVDYLPRLTRTWMPFLSVSFTDALSSWGVLSLIKSLACSEHMTEVY